MLVSSSAFCCEVEVSLYGESIYKGDSPETVYGKIETTWNANSEIYDTLYLRTKSKAEGAKLIITKNEKQLSSKEIKIEKSNKSDTYRLTNISFKDDLIARNQDFPFSARIDYSRDGKKFCTQTIKFMVTK